MDKQVCITFDTDWAPDFVLQNIAERMVNARVKSTWFVTNASPVIGDLQYRIGFSESDDFVNWTRMDDRSGLNVTPGDFDSNMICYPNLVQHKGDLFMFYNGNSFGKDGFALAKRVK